MSANTWEVVGSKKKGQDFNIKIKSKKKVDNLPKLAENGPLKEDRTIFEAFLEKERKHEEMKKKNDPKTNGNVDNKNKKNGIQAPVKKKVQEKKKEVTKPPSTFEEVLNQLSIKDIKNLLDTVQIKFPEVPSIWLKDLASYLNLKLTAEIVDQVFCNKPSHYPSSALPKGIHQLLKNTLSLCNTNTLNLFFEHCVSSIVQEGSKPDFSSNVNGYRVFLQCLGQVKPEIILNNLPKLIEVRNSCQNRHPVCLTLLWAAGQAGLTNLKAGLKIWLEVMFPVVGMRAFSKYTVEYLEELFKLHPDTKPVSDVLGVREYFPVFDFLYSTTGSHAPNHRQLLNFFPRLKALSYCSSQEPVMSNFFPSYLNRLQSTTTSLMKEEVLSSLVECLAKDKHSYSVWRQMYTKHFTESSILLQHLLTNFDKLPSNLPQKLLKETVNSFLVTNDEISVQKKTGMESTKYCDELLAKMSVWRFPWRGLIFVVIFTLTALVFYDINLHGSFKASKTGKYLKEYGVLAVYDQAVAKVLIYTKKTARYLEKNVPLYYGKACKVVGPYFKQILSYLLAAGLWLWDASQPLWLWLNKNIPPLLQSVTDNFPQFWSNVRTQFAMLSELSNTYILWVWTHLLHTFSLISHWLQEHVFTGGLSPDKLQRMAGGMVAGMQQYTKSAYQWFMEAIPYV